MNREKSKQFMEYINKVNPALLQTLNKSRPTGGVWNTQIRFLPEGVDWTYYNKNTLLVMLYAGKEEIIQ